MLKWVPQKNPLWGLLHQVLEFHSEPQTTRKKKSSPPLEGPQIIPPTTATELHTKSASSPRVFSTTVFPPAFGPVRRRHWLLVPNLTHQNTMKMMEPPSLLVEFWLGLPTPIDIPPPLPLGITWPPEKKTQGTSKLHSAARVSLTFFPPRSIRHGFRAWKSFRWTEKWRLETSSFHACLHWMIPSSPTLGTCFNRWNRWMTNDWIPPRLAAKVSELANSCLPLHVFSQKEASTRQINESSCLKRAKVFNVEVTVYISQMFDA